VKQFPTKSLKSLDKENVGTAHSWRGLRGRAAGIGDGGGELELRAGPSETRLSGAAADLATRRPRLGQVSDAPEPAILAVRSFAPTAMGGAAGWARPHRLEA
jgi:hypothetical protein